MDVRKNIYCIINFDEFSLDEIIKDLRDEGYNHNFIFGNYHDIDDDRRLMHLEKSNEVWEFGDCSNIKDHILAKELGCDLWVMK